MSVIVGDIKSLRASERIELDRLATRRVNPRELLDGVLAQRVARLVAQAGVQIGLIIGRDGAIEFVAVGTKDRVYLPDLGRFRLDPLRLRRLRLVVFMPPSTHQLVSGRESRPFLGRRPGSSAAERHREIRVPRVPSDLTTDLEKLRFDFLLVGAVGEGGSLNGWSLLHLAPANSAVLRADRTRAEDGDSHPIRTPSELSGAHESTTLSFFARDLLDFEVDAVELTQELETLLASRRSKTFDTSKTPAVLVGAYTGSAREAAASMEELAELARTAGIEILDRVMQRRRALDPRTVIGKGKIEEIVLHCLDLGAELLVFDRELSPGQLRTITNMTELKVIDRSMLILDIFAQRAVSSEGRLQVELAQLRYSLPRLTERDSGLSRLTGGIGGRGPGETKLEIGRRRARDRISELERRIERLAGQRGMRRERRQERGVPIVAIVGYTNAGKSTLINALTKSEVFVENKLFATLDPTSRRMRFPNEKEVLFVDTVGFIRELPKELVAAFRATLEEVGEADLLLHLVDGSDSECMDRIKVVEDTLTSLSFEGKPRLLVLNKVDRLSEVEQQSLVRLTGGLPISALQRVGLEELIQRVQGALLETFTGRDPGRFTEIQGW